MESVTSPAAPAAGPTRDEQAAAVERLFRTEVAAPGLLCEGGDVQEDTAGVLAHVGRPSVLNRAAVTHLDGAVIERAADFFGALPHSLWTRPPPPDGDVQRHLRAHGYVPLPPQRGLARDVRDGLELPTTHHAELLADPELAPEVAAVYASGTGLPSSERGAIAEVVRAVLEQRSPWDGSAVYGIWSRTRDAARRLAACAVLLHAGPCASLPWVATLAPYRHRGMATALVARGLRDAAALGARTAVSVSTPESLRMLARLGFRTVTEYSVYRQVRP